MKRLLLALLSAAVLISLVFLLRPLCPQTPVGQPSGGSGNLDLYGVDPNTLDPALAGDADSNEYITQIFSGLVKLDDSLQPVPDIAERWEISPDGLSYTFYLRQNVYFHNGRQVKAEDFKYSWERAALPATGSHTVATYLGDISGIAEMLSGASQSLSGVEVLDDFTLRLRLNAPRSYFLAKLSYITSSVVDRADVARGLNWWSSPRGTGPFTLQKWVKGDSLVLARFPEYYGEKARLATVTFHILAGIPLNLYETDEIDVARVDASYYDLVTDPSGAFKQELVITPELSLDYIIFDITRPPFDDINVRKALAMSVDKAKLAAVLFRNTVSPAEGLLPSGIPGYNEFFLGAPFDVARASEYLASSHYGSNLPQITLTVTGYGGQISPALEAIIYDWQHYLGVDVEVRQLELDAFLYNLQAEKDNLVYFSWNADYAHPQNFLGVLFGEGMEYNIGGYESSAFNSLLDQAGEVLDVGKSLELYGQAESVLINDAACIPLWSGEGYTLIKPAVQGYIPNPLGIVRLNTVWLE